MAFVCPKCGATEYKVAKDGIRQCAGRLVFSRSVRLVKPEFAPPGAVEATPVQQSHSVSCPTWWFEADDAKYLSDG